MHLKQETTKEVKLGLVFTFGMSLAEWDRLGLLDREKLIYEMILEKNVADTIYWFTYGAQDKTLEKLLKKGIVVVPKPRFLMGRLGNLIYSFVAPFLLGSFLKNCDVIKTNQMRGSWTAVIASWIYRKPLIVRTGYTWSLFARNRKKFLSLDRLAGFIEGIAYRAADRAVVSSRQDADYVKEKYGVPSEKLKVIGNYIDVSIFRPDLKAHRYKDRLVFVGRLSPQKNLSNLIRALANLPYYLDIYHHDDSAKDELQALARATGSQVTFKGSVPNRQLSGVLNQYSLFVLPSLYEGMPKVLLEAMACGLAVLGTNVVGINEVIHHGKNGFLINGTDAESLRKGIQSLAENPQLQKDLGATASRFIQQEFSLEAAFEKERSMYKELHV